MKSKKANFLTENVIFIIIAVLFVAMLFVFVSKTSSSTRMIEESEAKKIALILDSAEPGTEIKLNIDSLLESKQESLSEGDIFRIENNRVNVRLKSGEGYSYSFFNKIQVKSQIGSREQGGVFLYLSIEDVV